MAKRRRVSVSSSFQCIAHHGGEGRVNVLPAMVGKAGWMYCPPWWGRQELTL